MFDILFENATIITMTDNGVIYNGCCAVEGHKIIYVGNKLPDCTDTKRVIDCKGNILMPGLINCHTHNAMTVLRGYSDDLSLNDWLFKHIFPAEAKLDYKSVEAGFTLGLAEMIASGTTAFCDMYFYSDKTAQIADKSGIRAVMSNSVIALSDDYDFDSDRAVTELYSMIENKALSDRIIPAAAIHCERTSPPWVWERESKIAKDYDLIMNIHLSETESDQNQCYEQYGKTPAEILNERGVFDTKTIAAHCVHLSESDMKLLADKGVTAVHNPVSNLKLASGVADVCKMIKFGVNVALGTDGCSSNNTLDMFEEMKAAALLAKNKSKAPENFTAPNAIELATVNGAKALGLENKTGKISPGLEADIILIDMSKLHRIPMYDAESSVVYCLGGGDVYMTMVQGKILYENGIFNTIDINSAIKTVKEYVMPIVRSVDK